MEHQPPSLMLYGPTAIFGRAPGFDPGDWGSNRGARAKLEAPCARFVGSRL